MDLNEQVNQQIVEIANLQAKVAKLSLELERLQKENKPLRKAFTELLEDAMTLRDRMGLDMTSYEYDWMDKAGLL